MATTVEGMSQGQERIEGMGIFDLLYLAWLDFLHIIQQLKFGIFLLMVIAVMTLIGASVPQAVFGDTPADFLTYYTPTQYKWILILGFDHIFHTGYFLSVLGLLIVSVTLCAFGRLNAARKLARNIKPHTSIHELVGTRFNDNFEIPGRTVENLVADLGKLKYTTFTRVGPKGETQLLARRGLTAKWANVTMHFMFIVMAVGSMITVASQLDNQSAGIREGEVYVQPDTGQRIKLVEYFQEYRPADFPTIKALFDNQFPTDFKSRLQVLDENDKVIKEEVIEVNKPLIHDWVTYYQSSFGQIPEFRIQAPGMDATFLLDPETPTMVPGLANPLWVRAPGGVVGGYWLAEDGTRGEELPFHAKVMEGKPNPSNPSDPMRRYYPMKAINGDGIMKVGEPVVLEGTNGPVTLTLKGVHEHTVLQVKRDRGVGIMYTAFVITVFGILYPLFYPYHDGRFVLEQLPEGGVRVWWGSRYRAGRRAFVRLQKRWLGLPDRDEEEDLKGDFAF